MQLSPDSANTSSPGLGRAARCLVALLAGLVSFSCLADLKLDQTQKKEDVARHLGFFFNKPAKAPYEALISEDAQLIRERWDGRMEFNPFGGSQFSWIFNNKRYLSSVVSFDRQEASRLENQDLALLIMFKPDTTVAAAKLLKLNKRDSIKGRPYFLDMKAMSVAPGSPDLMLIVVNYVDSADLLADPQGNFKVFTSTLAFRFQDSGGRLRIAQDDSCLGNPNNVNTIAAARKRLASCKR